MPELLAALPGVALEGESTLPLARIGDHHLSWAQWFADSAVPGVIRARWFEQRHMLHHTRRWNRDHSDELRSAWLNGVGMLVWENVFGSWVGLERARPCAAPQAMTAVQRRHAELLTHGDVDAARGPQRRRVRRRLALAARRRRSSGRSRISRRAVRRTVSLDGGRSSSSCRRRGSPRSQREASRCSAAARRRIRRARPSASRPRSARAEPCPTASSRSPPPRPLVARFRVRETGIYGEVPYVEEWKPLPPRLHGFAEVERPGAARRVRDRHPRGDRRRRAARSRA